MLILSEADVEQLLDLDELRHAMERALIEFSAGRVSQPVRTIVPVAQHNGLFATMPAVYGDVMGSKLVTVFPGNAARGIHTHNAIVQLFRAETGEPLAVVEGRTITARRTAAVSALATQALSRNDGGVLAILGSGVQARSHCAALQRVRRFTAVRIWSRNEQHARLFAAEVGAEPAPTAEEAVRDADVVVTVTNSQTPILKSNWLKAGAHINAVGSVGPQSSEIDAETMRDAAVVVESRESALKEAGEIHQSGARIYAELGEVLAGIKQVPRDGRITVYKALGIAVEDIAAAQLVCEKFLGLRQARGG